MLQDFPNGLLWMVRENTGTAIGDPLWIQETHHAIPVVLVAIILLADIKDLMVIWHPLMSALTRMNGLVNIEYNIQYSRTRSRLAFILVLALALCADRYELTPWSYPVLLGALAGLGLAVWLISVWLKPAKVDEDVWDAVWKAPLTLIIPTSALVCVTVIIGVISGLNEDIIRAVLYACLGIDIVLSLFKSGEILNRQYGSFRTFLYLCALIILPISAFIVAAVMSV